MDPLAERLLDEADARPAVGWEFAWLGDRLKSSPLAWDFSEIVCAQAHSSPDMLDLGTGGGEWLSILPCRPRRTVATEGWAPNVEVAGARLRPLSVTVVSVNPAPDNVDQRADEAERGRLPFPPNSFELISSRHESYLASEVGRVLTPGGVFVTEQIGGDYGDYYEALGLPRPAQQRPHFDLGFARGQLEAAALVVVDGGEAAQETTFSDVGAFAWYLKAIPWVVGGFSISRYRPQLSRLQERVQRSGRIAVREPAFWLKAVKDAREKTRC